MCKKDSVGDEVTKSNNVANLDALANLAWKLLRRKYLPVVVGVVVGVASDLLSLRGNSAIVVTERVAVGVAVKVDLSFLVTQSNRVVVVDAYGLERHHVIAQSFLELWGHEIVSGAGPVEDSEVDLEPEQVEEEWDDDQTNDASSKVFAELGQRQRTLAALDVHQIP